MSLGLNDALIDTFRALATISHSEDLVLAFLIYHYHLGEF